MTVPCACGEVPASEEAWAAGPRVSSTSDVLHTREECAPLDEEHRPERQPDDEPDRDDVDADIARRHALRGES